MSHVDFGPVLLLPFIFKAYEKKVYSYFLSPSPPIMHRNVPYLFSVLFKFYPPIIIAFLKKERKEKEERKKEGKTGKEKD